jgi:hypothetical protein
LNGKLVAALVDVAVRIEAFAEASVAAIHGPEERPDTSEIVSPSSTEPVPIVIAAPATTVYSTAAPRFTGSVYVEACANDEVVAKPPINTTGMTRRMRFSNGPRFALGKDISTAFA